MSYTPTNADTSNNQDSHPFTNETPADPAIMNRIIGDIKNLVDLYQSLFGNQLAGSGGVCTGSADHVAWTTFPAVVGQNWFQVLSGSLFLGPSQAWWVGVQNQGWDDTGDIHVPKLVVVALASTPTDLTNNRQLCTATMGVGGSTPVITNQAPTNLLHLPSGLGMSGPLQQDFLEANSGTSYQVLATDGTMVQSSAAGAFTYTMPLALNIKAGTRFRFCNNSTHNVVVAGSGSDMVNGAASITSTAQYDWIEVMRLGATSWLARKY